MQASDHATIPRRKRLQLQDSLEQFLAQVARRGSWVGGGSVAALSAALAAALLEKLVTQQPKARRLQRIRRDCLRLIHQDARAFARVIAATRGSDHRAFQRTLQPATEVPCQVAERAEMVRVMCRASARAIKPRFQSDLKCADALASAARTSARALITTNVVCLDNPVYAKAVQRRLRSAARRHAR